MEDPVAVAHTEIGTPPIQNRVQLPNHLADRALLANDRTASRTRSRICWRALLRGHMYSNRLGGFRNSKPRNSGEEILRARDHIAARQKEDRLPINAARASGDRAAQTVADGNPPERGQP